MQHILVVDDQSENCEKVSRALGESYRRTCVPSLEEARAALEKEKFDLILLEATLPDGDGFRFCSELQADPRTKDVPVIFLTTLKKGSDVWMGFSVGASDYVRKPFDPLELKARVQVRLKSRTTVQEVAFNAGDFHFDLGNQSVMLRNNRGDEKLDLTPREFRLLVHLGKNMNQIFSRVDLIRAGWGERVHINKRTIDTHLSHLRKKIKKSTLFIESVPGKGYRLSRRRTELLKARAA